MRTTVLEPVGAQITDLEVNALDSDQAKQLERLLADHGVAVLRDQPLDDDEFDAFLRHFGDPVFTVGETPVDGHPELNVISNVGRTRPPRSRFHVDTSYVRHPPAYTALRAVQVPSQGGQTLFSNQYRAYERLPEALRQRLEGRVMRHVVTGVDPGETQEREAEHPIFRPHPLTGRV
ncbi:MAG: TauD/TfdA family dioxygenase, partial [Terracoccus sp.]